MDAVNDERNRDLTDDELHDWLLKRRVEIQYHARLPANEVRVVDGEASDRLGDLVKLRVQLPGWTTRLLFTFTRERLAGRVGTSTTRLVEHLSIGFTVPDRVEKGEVALMRDNLLGMLAPIVSEWFEDDDAIHAQLTPSDPVAVGHPETRQVTFRTPITAHFIKPVDDNGIVDKRGF